MFDFIKKPLNFTYVLHLLLVFFISTGAISRSWSFALLALLVIFIIFRPIRESLILFARSIPFYIAIPLNDSFDSFNTWRIVTALIAVKWIFIAKEDIIELLKIKLTSAFIKSFWAKNKMEILGAIIFLISFISLFKAYYLFAGVKRLIYFANLSLVFPVIVWAFKKEIISIREISKNIAIPVFLIVGIACFQLLTAYILNLGEFMMFWAGQIQEAFYGRNWSQIVFSANTWFAYNAGIYPKLRIFSTFPDSHSFSLYLLTGIPFIITISLEKISNLNSGFSFKFNGGSLAWIASIIIIFLALILSGTRGIWISAIFPILFYVFLIKFLDNGKYLKFSLIKNLKDRIIIKSVSALLILFFIAFVASYAVLTKNQFLFKSESNTEQRNVLNRIRSIVDTSETSNSARINIWKNTFVSVVKNPFLGVGIGNFPVVIGQSIESQKAGASAHNLYLNILAETGIISFLVFVMICFLVLKYAWEIFSLSSDNETKIFAYSFLLYILWIFGYNLTDAALFDEREFLMFILVLGIIVGIRKRQIINKPLQ